MRLADLRADVPLLAEDRIVYADSACMTLRPTSVVDAISTYYLEHPACAGRSAHELARKTTEMVERVRKDAMRLFNLRDGEVLFTKNASEALNLIARSVRMQAGDEVIVSAAEHNSNLVPWLARRDRDGIAVRIAEHDEHERIDVVKLEAMISDRTRIVSIVGRSNVLGVRNDLEAIARICKKRDVLFVVDGCQMALSDEILMAKVGIDGFALSAHKMLGPSGLGALVASKKLLDALDPFLVGGDTVDASTYDSYELASGHRRFEAGLQNYAGIAGLGEAMRIVRSIGHKTILAHEQHLTKRLQEGLPESFSIVGCQDPLLRGPITCIAHDKLNHHEVSQLLDHGFRIATRAGRHCVHSWFEARSIAGCTRISFGPYSNESDVDRILEALRTFA